MFCSAGRQSVAKYPNKVYHQFGHLFLIMPMYFGTSKPICGATLKISGMECMEYDGMQLVLFEKDF